MQGAPGMASLTLTLLCVLCSMQDKETGRCSWCIGHCTSSGYLRSVVSRCGAIALLCMHVDRSKHRWAGPCGPRAQTSIDACVTAASVRRAPVTARTARCSGQQPCTAGPCTSACGAHHTVLFPASPVARCPSSPCHIARRHQRPPLRRAWACFHQAETTKVEADAAPAGPTTGEALLRLHAARVYSTDMVHSMHPHVSCPSLPQPAATAVAGTPTRVLRRQHTSTASRVTIALRGSSSSSSSTPTHRDPI
jgi:hypothetical protein